MEEYIGKVKLNYDFYSGDDSYSDGSIEDTLLDIVKNTESDMLEKRIAEEEDWAVLYHLSDIRKNILEWYDMKPGANVLEIGAGCGAVTGVLCDKAEEVVCIDLSKKRSHINAYRNQQYDNLTIYVGNFKDIKIEEKFDYVTLIGVLEYSIFYVGGDNPFEEMIRRAKEYLKPDGKLIIAIENKYGLKYWAGASEDHTGKRFDGITGYTGVDRVRTFSRQKLEAMVKKTGFPDVKFFYPVPDYKMPMEIYSDRRLPKKGDIKDISPAYDRERMLYFDEVKAFDSICEDGLFPTFANSFLVIAGQEDNKDKVPEREVLYSKFNRLRAPIYRMQTRIVKEKGVRYVDKKTLSERGYIEKLKTNQELVEKLYKNLSTVRGSITGDTITYPYIMGRRMDSEIDYSEGDPDDMIRKINEIADKVQQYNPEYVSTFKNSDEFRNIFGNIDPGECDAVCPANIDEVLSNIIETDEGTLYEIDFEWVFKFPIPVRYIRFRIFHYLYYEHVNELKDRIDYEEYMTKAGFSDAELDIYADMESSFQRMIYGSGPENVYTAGYVKPVHNIDLLLKHKDNLLAYKTRQYEIEHARNENIRHAIRNPFFGVGLVGKRIKRKAKRNDQKKKGN